LPSRRLQRAASLFSGLFDYFSGFRQAIMVWNPCALNSRALASPFPVLPPAIHTSNVFDFSGDHKLTRRTCAAESSFISRLSAVGVTLVKVPERSLAFPRILASNDGVKTVRA
jgi:hypothetical protein